MMVMVEYGDLESATFRFAGTKLTEVLGFDPTKKKYLDLPLFNGKAGTWIVMAVMSVREVSGLHGDDDFRILEIGEGEWIDIGAGVRKPDAGGRQLTAAPPPEAQMRILLVN